MSLFSDIGDAFSSAAHDVGKFVEGAADVVGNTARDFVENSVDGILHTFDSPMSVLKGVAGLTILAPYSIFAEGYELGSDLYKETDKELNKK